MAVPARRTSSRKKKLRQNPGKQKFFRKNSITLIKCNNCQAEKRPHQICSACSTYRSLKY